MHWFIDPIKNKYADFEGRTGREEYWMFILIYIGIAIVVMFVSSFLNMLLTLALLVPNIAIAARRLHDTGKSGWWQLVALIPILGLIILIILLVIKGEEKENKYGPALVSANNTENPFAKSKTNESNVDTTSVESEQKPEPEPESESEPESENKNSES